MLLPDEQKHALADMRLRRAMVRFLHGVYLGGELCGPLAIAWAHTPKAEPRYVATDEMANRQPLTEYGSRMDIDESFRDDRPGGFQ